jgi:hypothetical protein
MTYYTIVDKLRILLIQCKAMRKTGFSGFSCFAKDKTDLFSYSNLKRKKISASVLTKISRKNAEVNAKLEVQNHCTKIIVEFDNSDSNEL